MRLALETTSPAPVLRILGPPRTVPGIVLIIRVPSGMMGRGLLIWGCVRVRGELKSSVNSGERKITSPGKFKPEVQVLNCCHHSNTLL